MMFTTDDRDNDNNNLDLAYNYNCAVKWGGGNWYNYCNFFNIHGRNSSSGNWLRLYNPTSDIVFYYLLGGRMMMTRIG